MEFYLSLKGKQNPQSPSPVREKTVPYSGIRLYLAYTEYVVQTPQKEGEIINKARNIGPSLQNGVSLVKNFSCKIFSCFNHKHKIDFTNFTISK